MATHPASSTIAINVEQESAGPLESRNRSAAPIRRRSTGQRRSFAFALTATIAPLLLVAVFVDPVRNQPIVTSDLEKVFHNLSTVSLEEPGRVINVTPTLTVDGLGNYLVADRDEAQLRVYQPVGDSAHLRTVVGRKGSGPREFRRPVAALRLNSGEFVGVDGSGSISVFDASGGTLLAKQTTGLAPIFEALVVNDSVLALSGKSAGPSQSKELVHLWNIRSGQLLARIFPAPTAPPRLEDTYEFTGTAVMATHDGELAVLHTLGDSIRIYDGKGEWLRSVPTSFSQFRALKEPMPVDDKPGEFDAWIETFTIASTLSWLPDGSLIVQYLDVEGGEQKRSLVRLSTDGRTIFEVFGVPRLLAVSPVDSSLIFIHPDAEYANQWLRAELRDEIQ